MKKCCNCKNGVSTRLYCGVCIRNISTEAYFKGVNMANKSHNIIDSSHKCRKKKYVKTCLYCGKTMVATKDGRWVKRND